MKLSYDADHNVADIRFREKVGSVTTLRLSEDLLVDISADGTVYGIELLNANKWLEQVLEAPERTEPDPVDADLEHRLGRIKAHEGRWLRVIVKKQSSPVRVITMYFDRRLRRA